MPLLMRNGLRVYVFGLVCARSDWADFFLVAYLCTLSNLFSTILPEMPPLIRFLVSGRKEKETGGNNSYLLACPKG
jgi:hypothetical protein